MVIINVCIFYLPICTNYKEITYQAEYALLRYVQVVTMLRREHERGNWIQFIPALNSAGT
jgi:hypothetical protein